MSWPVANVILKASTVNIPFDLADQLLAWPSVSWTDEVGGRTADHSQGSFCFSVTVSSISAILRAAKVRRYGGRTATTVPRVALVCWAP